MLLTHPKLGASWEGTAVEEIISLHHAGASEVFFWGIHQQVEIDLLIIKKGKKFGFKVKYTDSPKLTTSMVAAQEILKLDSLSVIYPGKETFPLGCGVQAIGLESLSKFAK